MRKLFNSYIIIELIINKQDNIGLKKFYWLLLLVFFIFTFLLYLFHQPQNTIFTEIVLKK